jgi:hypothetical protein
MSLTSTVANTRESFKAKRRPKKIQIPRRVPVARMKTSIPSGLTVETITNIDLVICIFPTIIESKIVIPHTMNARIMSITVIGTHTIMMAKDTPRTKTNARAAMRVVIRHLMLTTWRTEKIKDLALLQH